MTGTTTSNEIDTKSLQQAADTSRGLSMDAIAAAKSGHLGLPLGAAEIGAVLFGHSLHYNPEDPQWINRDRFVLSAGHGSMFLYSWLHLAGFDLPLEQVKKFRQLHSITPGHPEFNKTPGVESTTGPLGQGIGNSVGMAIAAKMADERYNTNDHTIFDHHIVCLCGDGCMQEGVGCESLSLAGHIGLDNLIFIYDSNDVTLGAMADKTQSEDTEKRFEAMGFEVQTINGNDLQEVTEAYSKAKSSKNGKTKMIIAKTLIGKGIPEVAGTNKAHGEAGLPNVPDARKALGLPEETFFVSEAVKGYFNQHKQKLQEFYKAWQETFSAWKPANAQLAQELDDALTHKLPADLMSTVPEFGKDNKVATRDAGGTVLNALAKVLPTVVSGSADLHGSTKNHIKNAGDFSSDNPTGRNFYFGIREHAMGAIVNGMGYYGIFRPSGATFLTFSDYLRPSIRLAALAHLPIFHIFTHDSVAVGEDGPTHQPVETTSALRLIPNLDVIRPADPEETVGAFVAALERTDGPTNIILTRQGVNMIDAAAKEKRDGTLKGGYILVKETADLDTILIATGSEIHCAIEAAKQLGAGTRVVSMPCCERFDRQSNDYKELVLPKSCKKTYRHGSRCLRLLA